MDRRAVIDEPRGTAHSDGAGSERASIYDVAELAGVSHMTVSRALNGYPHMKDGTRQRVLDAVRELNYTRSPIARALVTKRAMRIGVLIHGQVNHGPNTTLRAFEQAALVHGYAVSTISADNEDQRPLEAGVLELVTQGVDAVCVIATRPSSLARIRKYASRLPMMVVQDRADQGIQVVSYDQAQGVRRAVEYLIELGHREILHLSGPMDWYDAQVRSEAWRSALEHAGLECSEPGEGDWSSDAGYKYASDVHIGDATAIFVANDQMALGVLHGLRDRGIRVPDDVSVIGFDDLPEARHFSPPLTTIRQDFAVLGERMMTNLLAALEGRPTIDCEVLESTLIVRESAGPARSTR